jgi:protein tyrosine/serine phosphatase
MKPGNHTYSHAISITLALLLLNTYAFATPKQTRCANNLAAPIANFCEVKPRQLWRGAVPDNKEEAAWLVRNGVKTIINLELLHDDLNVLRKAELPNAGIYQLDYFRVKTWEPLYAFAQSSADEDVIHFLAIARQAKQPIYVHCRAGENRTGVMIAAYKIILENQTSPAQIADVVNEMQSYEGFWSDATTAYIKGLSQRRDQILQKVQAFAVEQPIRIIYDNGKAGSAL